jgi:hypothetical protein
MGGSVADGQDPDLLNRAILEGTITVDDLIENEVEILVKMSKAIESIVLDHERWLRRRLADLDTIDPSGGASQDACADEVPALRVFSTELRLAVIGVARRILDRVLKRRAEHLISEGAERRDKEQDHVYLERVDKARVLRTGESWRSMKALVDLRNLLVHDSMEGEIKGMNQKENLHARLLGAFGAHGLEIRSLPGVSEVILGNGLTDFVVEELRRFVKIYVYGS